MPNLTALEQEMLAALKEMRLDMAHRWNLPSVRNALPTREQCDDLDRLIAKAEPPKPRRWVVEFPDGLDGKLFSDGVSLHRDLRVSIIREEKPITREAISIAFGTTVNIDSRLRALGIEVED